MTGEVQILALGAFAGLTIYVGMPVARARHLSDRTRAVLGAIAVGILLFLFFDVLNNASTLLTAPIRSAPLTTVLYAVLLSVGFGAGTLLLVLFETRFTQYLRSKASTGTSEAGVPLDPLHVSTLIAVGIGLHNFAEGLAIGAAFASGIVSLAIVLVVGFAIHNSTEGFGILGPGLLGRRQYSWRRVGALGLVGGGPTFLGTAVGSLAGIEPAVSVLFYGLAAGAILYVVLQMSRPMLAPASRVAATVGVVVGFILGFATDMVVTFGGL